MIPNLSVQPVDRVCRARRAARRIEVRPETKPWRPEMNETQTGAARGKAADGLDTFPKLLGDLSRRCPDRPSGAPRR